jgi:succinyl-diaminopimelate desuccinylase
MLNAVGALAAALIERKSVTPYDCGCLELIGARLSACGFVLTPLPSGDVDNLWAVRGKDGPCLAFAGHTDVVPAGDLEAWLTPPFEATVQGGILYGRGAADMKGSLAAMVVAVERFVSTHPDHRGRIAFMLTSDEEGPATDGTVRITEFLEREHIEVEWCIVGEPSSAEKLGDTVRVGRRGSLNGHLTVRGIQGHVAYPDQADNPIHKAFPALEELCACVWDQGNEYYPPTSFQISNIKSGCGAENVIPHALEAWFNFRFCSEQSAEGLRLQVEQLLQRHALDYHLEWRVSGHPFLTPGGKLIDATVAIISEALGLVPELSTGGGTSDGRFIVPMGVELVELGPNNATIHKVNECVALEELDQLSNVYERLLQRLLIG